MRKINPCDCMVFLRSVGALGLLERGKEQGNRTPSTVRSKSIHTDLDALSLVTETDLGARQPTPGTPTPLCHDVAHCLKSIFCLEHATLHLRLVHLRQVHSNSLQATVRRSPQEDGKPHSYLRFISAVTATQPRTFNQVLLASCCLQGNTSIPDQ